MTPPFTSSELPILVSMDDPEPMYRQIEIQMRRLILGGQLAAGAKLPSVRALAHDLSCSVITTRRAYQELENAGFIRTRQGMGTVVAELPQSTMTTYRREPVESAFREAINSGRHAGMTDTELREAFEVAMEHATMPGPESDEQ